uniref:PIN domain-containing protein n=1 Tax=Spongospora subterranea TaxID=70186 RepID=A0A0H5QW47_9EUKA|eukprot:CRZ05977.1 hypothetical protein [Spongospora subterranea]
MAAAADPSRCRLQCLDRSRGLDNGSKGCVSYVGSRLCYLLCGNQRTGSSQVQSSPGRLGARTRQVIQHLHHCFSRRDPGVRGQVVSPELSAATNDDRILNYCISLRRTSRVLLFTNDLNFQVKAAIQDVPSIDRNDVFDDYFDEDLVRAFIDCLYNSTIHQL